MTCAYCGTARAVHRDHLVPKALRRRHPGWEKVLIPACAACNWRKGTRRLAPPGYDLTTLPGRGWRHWDGSAEALREVVR